MAKVKGIELKNIRTGFGHDGAGMQASIYLDGKRVGQVEDDGWGGGNEYRYTVPEAEVEVEKRSQQYFTEHPDEFTTLDIFIYEVFTLAMREKEFKKALKQGYKAVLYFPSFKVESGGYLRSVTYFIAELGMAAKVAAEEKREQYVVYSSLDDFVIE